MSYGQSYHDNQPITWIRRVPIYATTILTALLVVGMIACVILASARISLNPLTFSAPDFSRGALWQIFTFPFVGLPSFFTLMGFLCFYSWASEVEKFVGRARFFQLIGSLIFLEALVCLLWWWIVGAPVGTAGSYHLTAALLIAFATLYPNVDYLFGWVPLKWFAFACVLLGSLMYLPERAWPQLSLLWSTCAAAFGFIRWVQRGGEFSLPRLPSLRARPKLRVLPRPATRAERTAPEHVDATSEVDALLDKIAQHGLASLTPAERATLEKAREDLMKREPPRR